MSPAVSSAVFQSTFSTASESLRALSNRSRSVVWTSEISRGANREKARLSAIENRGKDWVPMQSLSGKKTRADASERLREVNLIGLAADLDDPLYHRELSIILEELKSIKSTRTRPPRGSQALTR